MKSLNKVTKATFVTLSALALVLGMGLVGTPKASADSGDHRNDRDHHSDRDHRSDRDHHSDNDHRSDRDNGSSDSDNSETGD